MRDRPPGSDRGATDRAGRRVRRAWRGLQRERTRLVRRLRSRLEETRILVHVSILLFVPTLVGLLTYLSNRTPHLSFFVFPPLAAGTYALFADPEDESASPARFVAGLTVGAVCAWIAMQVAIRFVYPGSPPSSIEVDAPGAAFAVLLTGVVTWALDVEEAAAYSMALLGLLVDPARHPTFVASVLVSTTIVAVIFAAWRELFYERRARYLYRSIRGDDRVLVPMRGDAAEATAMLGARLAAAHDAGKVVLLDVVVEDDDVTGAGSATEEAAGARGVLEDDGDRESGGEPPVGEAHEERAETAGPADDPDRETDAVDVETDSAAAVETGSAADDGGTSDPVQSAVADLEGLAGRIESSLAVPCQVVVAAADGSAARTVQQVGAETDCDLLATPYETDADGQVSLFVDALFRSEFDVLAHGAHGAHCGRTDWERVVVAVRGPSDTAHAMIDFGLRIAGADGHVSVARCISDEAERRRADEMLENLVETVDGHVETRVANAPVEDFLRRTARVNDLVIVGSSGERSRASRLVSPPTFERLHDIDTDIAIVDHKP